MPNKKCKMCAEYGSVFCDSCLAETKQEAEETVLINSPILQTPDDV